MHFRKNNFHFFFHTSKQKIQIQTEENRITQQRKFCPVQLLIGQCHSYNQCKFRHILTKNDRSTENIPRNGCVKLKIIDIQSPTQYTARLLEHRPVNGSRWTEINRSKDYLAFNLEFTKYYANTAADSIQLHCPIVIGDMAAIASDNIFYRCQVLDIIESKHASAITRRVQVLIKLIDDGRTTMVYDYHLLHLPKRFCDYPAQAVNVIISGIVPIDYDYSWDTASQKNVEKWIAIDESPHKCIKANISISLMNTIWVDTLYLVQKLPEISCEVTVISIKSSLLNNNLAIEDNAAFDNIKSVAAQIGILDETPHIFVSSLRTDCEPSATRARKKIRAERPKADVSNVEKIIIDSDSTTDSSNCIMVQQTPPPKQQKRNFYERWSELKENIFQRIFVGTFYTPHCCFIQTSPIKL